MTETADQHRGTVTLYEGPELAVRADLAPRDAPFVFAFSPRSGGDPLEDDDGETVGQVERFLASSGFPYAYFIARKPHWWQTADMAPALDAVRRAGIRERFARIACYGSSMGAYGALLFSKVLQADAVVALAPQYSPDQAKVPHETRWSRDRSPLGSFYDDMGDGLSPTAAIRVLLDPLCRPDRIHLDLLRRHRPIDLVPLGFADHNIPRALSDTGLLGETARAALRGTLDKAEFLRRWRERRRNSPIPYENAAGILAARHPAWAEAFAARACRLVAGRIEAAPGFLSEAFNVASTINMVNQWTRSLAALGRQREAIRAARDWDGRLGAREAATCAILARLLAEAGEIESAGRAMRIALARPRPIRAATQLRQAVETLRRLRHAALIQRFERLYRPSLLGDHRLAGAVGQMLAEAGLAPQAIKYLIAAAKAQSGEARVKLVRRQVQMLLRGGDAKAAAAAVRHGLDEPDYAEARRQLLQGVSRRLRAAPEAAPETVPETVPEAPPAPAEG